MKTTKQILTEAYELIGDKKRWCQGEFARYANGKEVAWCAIGAIHSVTDGSCHGAVNALSDACTIRYGKKVLYVNDKLGYAAIRRMFRKAIKAA